jgi:PTH1 family peptidyl-tRNA hydrolase
MWIFQKQKEKRFAQNHATGGNEMYVIAGLGNPGKQYEGTKHNIGFEVIDWLAKDYTIDITKFKHKALVGEGMICGKRVLLVKPQTYMNLSGESIREILKFYKVPLEHFMVIYDDTSLPEGAVRLREKGSAGGHNGIKNIIAHLGTDVFLRAKVGIGEKPNGWDLADYVLAKFSKDSLPMIQTGIEKAAHAVELYLSKGVADAMNITNQRAPKASKKSGNEKKEVTEQKEG